MRISWGNNVIYIYIYVYIMGFSQHIWLSIGLRENSAGNPFFASGSLVKILISFWEPLMKLGQGSDFSPSQHGIEWPWEHKNVRRISFHGFIIPLEQWEMSLWKHPPKPMTETQCYWKKPPFFVQGFTAGPCLVLLSKNIDYVPAKSFMVIGAMRRVTL